jgi:hypothetical protein
VDDQRLLLLDRGRSDLPAHRRQRWIWAGLCVIATAAVVGLLNHYGAVPRACRPYRAKTKGKVERPCRYVRQDFWVARSSRNLDDLNAQFDDWRAQVASPRVHATTNRVVDKHFAEEKPALIAHPTMAYSAVLTVERRVSHEGMVSVGGNLYSVPDATRRRVLEVQNHPARCGSSRTAH